ncbi:MAG: hypothetical protein WCO93_00100 [bacterium]
MNTREIEKLLERYEEGLTSIPEEKLLKEFFSGSDVPEHLRPYASLFNYFDQSKSETITNPDFDVKTDHLLSHPNLKSEIVNRKSIRHSSLVIRHSSLVTRHYALGIAASVLLIVGLFFTFRQDIFRKKNTVTYTEQQEQAYAEVQKALYTVSANLNIGLDQFRRLEPIGKAVDQVQKISKFYQYQPIIINPDTPTVRP